MELQEGGWSWEERGVWEGDWEGRMALIYRAVLPQPISVDTLLNPDLPRFPCTSPQLLDIALSRAVSLAKVRQVVLSARPCHVCPLDMTYHSVPDLLVDEAWPGRCLMLGCIRFILTIYRPLFFPMLRVVSDRQSQPLHFVISGLGLWPDLPWYPF